MQDKKTTLDELGQIQRFPNGSAAVETVTKKYRCIRPLTHHYFTFTWVKDDEYAEIRYACPVCGLPQTLTREKDAS